MATLASILPLHEWSCLRTEVVWIYDRKVDPSMHHWKAPADEQLPGHRAWFMRRGSVTIKARNRTFSAGAGQWITPVSKAQEVRFSKDAHIISIHFLCQWPSGENVLAGKEGLGFDAKEYPEMERLASKLERLLRKQFPDRGGVQQHIYNRKSSAYPDFLNVQALFLQWLAVWFQAQTKHGARLTRLSSGDNRPFQAARCLNQAPLDYPFPEQPMRKETGLGLMRLNQLFLAEFGLTTRKYWDRRRSEYAKECLETSNMPIKEIAGRLGFRSQSHFVVWFRRVAGCSPGEYRKRYLARAGRAR